VFHDFSDEDFAILLQAIENYSMSCLGLVNEAEGKGVPIELISRLVNIQRKEYDLEVINHSSYKDVKLDTVVSGSEYFFKSENLKLVLATTTSVKGNRGNRYDYICKIMKEVKKFLSFKTNYNFSIVEYYEVIKNYK